ncbi:hypothetical protein [Amycolatopsis nigrescens]|uniref:hypothetical protein n=1 Tax=Amycolatopsis nigrescens TaxID=381445 RepID=UPI00035EBC8D|nr:hypothetical protein [Amycolatopsis nigrescens]
MRKSLGGLAAALLLAGTAVTTPGTAAAAGAAADCPQWKQSEVATGFGLPLENLAFDGRGGLLVSATLFSGFGSIKRVTPDGEIGTLVDNVNGPGAIQVRDGKVYYNTGHNTLSGTLGLTDGTIDTVDLNTGERATWARNLTMPDGMTLLPNGDAVISTLIGPKAGLTRVPKEAPAAPVPYPRNVPGPNGLVVSQDGATLYAVSTLNPDRQIAKIDIAHPEDESPGGLRIDAPWPFNALDDLTIGPDGMIYTVGEHGIAYRVDPVSGSSCAISHEVFLGSSVRFGAGPGWDPASLYTTGFDGTVRRLTPPPS